jgi:signal transduction histidine kinase
MQITDDGVGFTATAPSTGHGLTSQRQRARDLGGALEIKTAPGRGTNVTLRVKLPSVSPMNYG